MMRWLLFLTLSFCFASLQARPVEITLWHSLAGQLGSELRHLADDFNQTQDEYVVKPIYKGDYIESLTSFAAAFRAKKPPVLVQVFEVGTSTMLMPKGIIKPFDELMKEHGQVVSLASFFPALLDRYSEKGHLMAMPLNTSVPVIFYNVDALAKSGYSSASFPRTWDAFEVMARALQKAGYACAYTSAYPAWIIMESYAAVHGLPLLPVKEPPLAVSNSPSLLRHITRLLRWQGQHYFEYGGRGDDATILFTSGHCALMSQSSGGYSSLAAVAPFRVGMAALPVERNAESVRFDNLVGGAALWASEGQSPVIYKGVAQFFSYLAKPSVQLSWHQHTGYLPLGLRGVYEDLVRQSKHPSLALAQSELFGHPKHVILPRANAENIIRAINDEALEAVFSGLKTPRQAMEDATLRSQHALLRFAHNTTGLKSPR